MNTGVTQIIGDLPGGGVEFTGNGLGELWGYAAMDRPGTVFQVDKSTAEGLVTYSLEGIFDVGWSSPRYWAWAFWGGDFYIFLQSSRDQHTKVYRVFGENGSGTPGQLETYMEDTGGKRIVGAGVSTCAPVVPPE